MDEIGPAGLEAEEDEDDALLHLGTWSAVGFVIGAVSAIGAYELYPPASSHIWTFPVLAAITLVVMAALYGFAFWLGDPRAGDWLVIGFVAALVVGTGLVVAREMVTLIDDEMPAAVWIQRLNRVV